MQKIKYINNKDLLAEIKICKASFCHFSSPDCVAYDLIVTDRDDITPQLLADTIRIKATRLSTKAAWVDPAGIIPSSIVFRVMSDDHLPPIDDKDRRLLSNGRMIKTNFKPFQHFILQDDELVEVGRSHWRGNFEDGQFNVEHGRISNRLATMFMLLVDQYSKRGNWRGYCVDETTEALTQRGWLNIDEINETDIILSYHEGQLKWSRIKSIFRDYYDGKMFKLTGNGLDALVTPGHKFITQDGLKKVEYLTDKDRVILTVDVSIMVGDIDFHGGRSVEINEPTINYKDRVWCPETEYGSFMARRNGIVYLSGNTYNDEMRSHALVQLAQVGLQFEESRSQNPFSFYTQIVKNCLNGQTMILTREHGSVAIEDVVEQDVTLLDGNGDWIKSHIYDYGVQETVNLNFSGNFEKISIRSTLDHGWVQQDTGERINTRDFIDNTKDAWIADLLQNDGWQVIFKDQTFERRFEKVYCPDVQTTHSFALASGIHSFNCFRRILNLERRTQTIRDDLLIMAGAMPSFTRQVDNEIEQREGYEMTVTTDKAKRGRKPKA